MIALALLLSRTLPVRRPQTRLSYGALIGSMARLAAATPALRLRAFYQACLFSAFSLFWTTAPLLLAGRPLRVHATGHRAVRRGGRLGRRRRADRRTARRPRPDRAGDGRRDRAGRGGVPPYDFAPQGSTIALASLVVAAVAIDFGVQANLVLGFRAVFALEPEARGRLNAVYLATFFLAGAIGSAVGAWAYARGGWPLASAIGLALPLVAMARFVFRAVRGR